MTESSAPAAPAPHVALYVGASSLTYKACDVVVGLRRQGCEVQAVVTQDVERFLGTQTLEVLSGRPVVSSIWSDAATPTGKGAHGMSHIEMAGWTDIQLVFPATPDLVSRLAVGLASDPITTAALACPAPLVIAPVVTGDIWLRPAPTASLDTLRDRGAAVLMPGASSSTSHVVGRTVDPAEVVDTTLALLHAGPAGRWLDGAHVVVTAGGTREPIDPVRFVGNRSSGKMGNALAQVARGLGAHVTLVTAAPPPPRSAGLDVVEVGTAAEMFDGVRQSLDGADLLIMAAAVADYRPGTPAGHKLKKTTSTLELTLVPTVDVLRALRDDPCRQGVVLVGFAAETQDLLENAGRKLMDKGLDLIVANDVGAPGIGMGSDENAVTILDADGLVASVPRVSKTLVAFAVLNAARPFVDNRRRDRAAGTLRT